MSESTPRSLPPPVVSERWKDALFENVTRFFALFVFSYLFGLVGTLVAVPMAAAIGVLVRFAVQLYLDSSVYKGSSAAAADGGAMPAAKDKS